MRRWNGWGDDHITYSLRPAAVHFLTSILGPGKRPPQATLAEVLARVPPTRLPAHPLLNRTPPERLRHALGQGFPDWVDARYGTMSTFPDAVAFPNSNEDVQALISYARDVGARLLPYGGGTSVVGHLRIRSEQQPVLVVDMKRMRRLLRVDTESRLATFQAGIPGPDLEAYLRAYGFTLGHFPQSFEYSTLGGWIATRSVGQESYRYGRMDEQFAGGRVETPMGPWVLPPYPASAAGPDLRQVVLGSEGRLGVITEAVVRISPAPEMKDFRAVFFPDLVQGLAALRQMAQERVPVSLLRLSTPRETRVLLALSGKGHLVRWLERWLSLRGAGKERCLLVVGACGTTSQSRQAFALTTAIAREHKGIIGPHLVAREWAKSRFRSPYLRNTLWELGYGVDTVETAAPWERIPALLTAVEVALRVTLREIEELGLVFSHISHVYPSGASIYTTFLFRLAETPEETMARWQALKTAVSWAIVKYGGTISHQHGAGTDHAPYLEAEKGPVGMAIERAIFLAADPEGLMDVRGEREENVNSFPPLSSSQGGGNES